MENVVKSIGKVKNNKENMLFYDFASERSERAEIFLIFYPLNWMGKMIKSMKNMKIDNENMYFASERCERAEIFLVF